MSGLIFLWYIRRVIINKNQMKKVILSLFAIAMSVSAIAQVKEVEVFKTSQNSKYDQLTVIYHTKDADYRKDMFEIKAGEQRIYLSSENMKNLATELRKAHKKCLEWDSIANVNDIAKVMKDNNPTSFVTDGGMLYDTRTFKSVSPTAADYRFERFYSDYNKKSFTYMNFGVFQFSDTRVYNAHFGMTFEINADVKAFNDFLNFLDNCVQVSNEIVAKDKMNLFN